MSYYPHQFEGPLERFGVGKARKIWYNVLFLPAELKSTLPFHRYPRLRVEGELADIPVENAFMPTGDGRYYLIVAPPVIKGADLALGDIVEMRFRIADQDRVDVPPALQNALAADADLTEKWEALTPGKKRMLCQHVLSAKTEKTTAKRVAEASEALRDFKADLKAWRNAKR
ncbi:MAG: YdeI/OmpD-associated family protein [Alphaproteobacteria bacterium]|nr:YdeI/OmpD-associated family protein [Alphaproteobacteria bacterium SS10]